MCPYLENSEERKQILSDAAVAYKLSASADSSVAKKIAQFYEKKAAGHVGRRTLEQNCGSGRLVEAKIAEAVVVADVERRSRVDR